MNTKKKLPDLQYRCQTCFVREGAESKFGLWMCRSCLRKIKSKEKAKTEFERCKSELAKGLRLLQDVLIEFDYQQKARDLTLTKRHINMPLGL